MEPRWTVMDQDGARWVRLVRDDESGEVAGGGDNLTRGENEDRGRCESLRRED
jgi:hypothetical protein